MDPARGIFYKFCEEYEIEAEEIEFSWKDILVPRVNEIEIEDILTEEDNFAFFASCS